ncbi:hypothetical protein THAOC_17604 [Thalassiosira oceanica]|uniref:Uncharacterized protein n=1 Tax=Thalassiosira oceanica TaxID=159749 RepID=K0SUA7_THAOC|nr:hypothetical protein THAOC_17604 [Thalassiosira oceanica]|eukprot:EJK61832.1 hypothetical protein THAOC_17604 [Thalassiosira oceanica]
MDMFAGGQRTNESVDDYGSRLRQISETHRAAGGSLGLHHPALYTASLAHIAQEAGVAVTALSAEQQASAVSKVEREYLATLIIVLTDERRFGGLKSRLKLEFKLQGTDNYPKTVTQALKMLSDWESETRAAAGTARGGTSSLEQSLAFAQTGGPFNEEKKDDGDVDPKRDDNDTFPPPPQDPGGVGTVLRRSSAQQRRRQSPLGRLGEVH